MGTLHFHPILFWPPHGEVLKPSFVARRGLPPLCPRHPVLETDTNPSVPAPEGPAPVAQPNPLPAGPMPQPPLVPSGGWQGECGYHRPKGEELGGWVDCHEEQPRPGALPVELQQGSQQLPTPETLSKGLPCPASHVSCLKTPGTNLNFLPLGIPISGDSLLPDHSLQSRNTGHKSFPNTITQSTSSPYCHGL